MKCFTSSGERHLFRHRLAVVQPVGDGQPDCVLRHRKRLILGLPEGHHLREGWHAYIEATLFERLEDHRVTTGGVHSSAPASPQNRPPLITRRSSTQPGARGALSPWWAS